MQFINNKTGRDVSYLVMALWDGYIDQEEFELLAMLIK